MKMNTYKNRDSRQVEKEKQLNTQKKQNYCKARDSDSVSADRQKDKSRKENTRQLASNKSLSHLEIFDDFVRL